MKKIFLEHILPIGLIAFLNLKYLGQFHCRFLGIVLSPMCLVIWYLAFYTLPSICRFGISKSKKGRKPSLLERLSPCAVSLVLVILTSLGMAGTPALALFNSYYISGVLYNLGRELCK